MRILIWTFRYSVASGVGGRRWRKFSRYLSNRGHDVWVVCPPEGSKEEDNVPQKTQTSHVRIIRTASRFYRLHLKLCTFSQYYERIAKKLLRIWGQRIYGYIDPAEPWARNSALEVEKLIREKKIDVVVATGHPCSLNYCAALVKSDFPNITLVQDFRDTWNDEVNYSLDRLGGLGGAKERSVQMEKVAINYANFVLNVSPGQSRRMRSNDDESKFQILTNGFDPEDYQGLTPVESESFRLVHAGTIRWSAANGFLELLFALAEIEDELSNLNFRIDFYGKRPLVPNGDVFQRMTSKFIRFHGYVHPNIVAQSVASATAGLIIFDKENGYSTKIFDYMGLGKPFLAICPPGELRDFCSENDMPTAGYNRTDIKDALLRLMDGVQPLPPDKVKTFSIPRLVEKLEEVMSE